MADAPDATGVPPVGPHPPVSIVVDPTLVHKLTTCFQRHFLRHFRIAKTLVYCFCYDERVRQRQAVRQGRAFLKHVIPAIIKPVHSLWHQVIGFLFMSFGIIFGAKAIHYYKSGEGVQFFVSASCTLMMLGFGLSSFLRSRKISRS
jgi:hypothetical protein